MVNEKIEKLLNEPLMSTAEFIDWADWIVPVTENTVPEGWSWSSREYHAMLDAYPCTTSDEVHVRGEFRTHCKCCGSLMPYTETELNTCEHCGATQNTFDNT